MDAQQTPPADPHDIGLMGAQVVGVALAAALVAVVVYVSAFVRLPIGGPDAWGKFGDYFGGVVNPIVGVATAFLVYFTLAATRKEARETREKMQAQLNLMADQHVLRDMQKRMDGVMDSWNQLRNRKKYSGIVGLHQHGAAHHVNWDWDNIFSHASTQASASRWDVDKVDGEDCANLIREFSEGAQLMMELANYCSAYEKFANDRSLTDYYRRRVSDVIAMFGHWQLLPNSTVAQMRVEPY